jgi:murein L,D-transpeptidase YafK
MKIFIKLMLVLMMAIPAFAQSTFKQNQLKFERVKNAYAEKWASLQTELQSAGLTGNFNLYIAAYKSEGKLELWLKTADKKHYKLFKTYDFCAHSGILGPKVIEGDGQTPEGFYKINVFNPESSFHLSLGVDYPNKVDAIRTGKGNKTGGDIYIHGNCVTVGCIPLTDEKIKEVYVLAVEARNGGQEEIPVTIFPFKMTNANLKKYSVQFPQQANFWQTLQKGYTVFDKDKNLAKVDQVNGNYMVK